MTCSDDFSSGTPGDEIPSPQRHRAAVHRLMTVDVSTTSRSVTEGRLAPLAEWIATFEWFGQQLADLNRQGRLERGLRDRPPRHLPLESSGPPRGGPARLVNTRERGSHGNERQRRVHPS